MGEENNESEKTIILSLVFENLTETTLFLPTPPLINIIEEEKDGVTELKLPVILEGEGLEEGMNLKACFVDVTNDPTPTSACRVVSLGYYSLRMALGDCTLVSLNPLTLRGKKPEYPRDGVNVRFTRPLRRVVEWNLIL